MRARGRRAWTTAFASRSFRPPSTRARAIRPRDDGRSAEEALLDAAERLLVEVGYAGITTRRLAEAAGVNHGLVHYYFGSNEALLVRAIDARSTGAAEIARAIAEEIARPVRYLPVDHGGAARAAAAIAELL